jgi:hypothetical protein
MRTHLSTETAAGAQEGQRCSTDSQSGAAYFTSLEILRTQPAVLGETREHPRAEFLPVVEREDHVRPAGTSEHLVRTSLALDGPTDAQKCGENEASSSAGPVAHAALKEMLR